MAPATYDFDSRPIFKVLGKDYTLQEVPPWRAVEIGNDFAAYDDKDKKVVDEKGRYTDEFRTSVKMLFDAAFKGFPTEQVLNTVSVSTLVRLTSSIIREWHNTGN